MGWASPSSEVPHRRGQEEGLRSIPRLRAGYGARHALDVVAPAVRGPDGGLRHHHRADADVPAVGRELLEPRGLLPGRVSAGHLPDGVSAAGRGLLLVERVLQRPLSRGRLLLRNDGRGLREPRPLLLEELRGRAMRRHRRLRDARPGLRGDGRLLHRRDLLAGRVPRGELPAVRRRVQRHEGLLWWELRLGPLPSGDVHDAGRGLHDGLPVLHRVLRPDGHLPLAVPHGERGLRAGHGLLRGAPLRDGHVPHVGRRVSADERDVRELDAVLLGPVSERALRGDELRPDRSAVRHGHHLLLGSVPGQPVPVESEPPFASSKPRARLPSLGDDQLVRPGRRRPTRRRRTTTGPHRRRR